MPECCADSVSSAAVPVPPNSIKLPKPPKPLKVKARVGILEEQVADVKHSLGDQRDFRDSVINGINRSNAIVDYRLNLAQSRVAEIASEVEDGLEKIKRVAMGPTFGQVLARRFKSAVAETLALSLIASITTLIVLRVVAAFPVTK